VKLVLPARLAAAIAEAARAASPRECCGLLEGTREGQTMRVAALHPARNLATAPDRFEIDPADHFAATRAARGKGRRIVGCYHSHPGGKAMPSEADRAGGSEDDFLWLIAGEDGLGAFVYSRGRFTGADWVTSPE
jgi:proteasome lid subunit RPN8/RPN11